jgi:hypothetical protein
VIAYWSSRACKSCGAPEQNSTSTVYTASVIPASLPGVMAAVAWAIQRADFAEALEANYLRPRPTSREGISTFPRISVFNGHPDQEFNSTYNEFKRLYREHHREWDELTLSFVICRSSEHVEDDRFYASVEHDPLFCRKYVIRAHEDVTNQREELLRLPFLPLRTDSEDAPHRPQSAQDLLQAAGISASLSRKLIEAGHRSAERIVLDLRHGNEPLPEPLVQPSPNQLALTSPRAHSRLVSLAVALSSCWG